MQIESVESVESVTSRECRKYLNREKYPKVLKIESAESRECRKYPGVSQIGNVIFINHFAREIVNYSGQYSGLPMKMS